LKKRGVACSLHQGRQCKQWSLFEKQLEAKNGKAHDGQSSRWDGPVVSAIEKQKHVHPPWHDEDVYLRKGKIDRVHAYSARGGVSPCDDPLRQNGMDGIQKTY